MTSSLSGLHAGSMAGKVDVVTGRWLLWVDGVGGYQLLPGDDWSIGGPSGAAELEICIQGDLSRREACIRRQGGDYVLQPLGTALLGGRRMSRPTLLRDGDSLAFGTGAVDVPMRDVAAGAVPGGRGVRMEFAKPHPLSASARLTLRSRHRTRPHSDGLILVADTCVIGPQRSSHILAPAADSEVAVLYHQGRWFCRGGSEIRIGGRRESGRVEVPVGERVEACGLAFTIEGGEV